MWIQNLKQKDIMVIIHPYLTLNINLKPNMWLWSYILFKSYFLRNSSIKYIIYTKLCWNNVRNKLYYNLSVSWRIPKQMCRLHVTLSNYIENMLSHNLVLMENSIQIACFKTVILMRQCILCRYNFILHCIVLNRIKYRLILSVYIFLYYITSFKMHYKQLQNIKYFNVYSLLITTK